MARLLAARPACSTAWSGGGFEVGFRGADVERVLSRLDALVNRLVVPMLASAFDVGLAALVAVYHPPGWQVWSGFALGFGILLTGALGVYLAWSILRPGRRRD